MPEPTAAVGIERHWAELTAYLTRRTGDAAAAADLTQETYLRAAALPDNATLLNPRAWLFATARNLLIARIRRGRGRGPAAGGEALKRIVDQRPDAEATLLSREALAVLADAVDALPPRTREVFRLHKFDGLSYAEIAARLGIAKNTVMVHMVKALGQCRAAMRAYREGEGESGGLPGAANGPAGRLRLPLHEG